MTVILLDIVGIFLLVMVNAVFAMTEIAVVSASRARLKRLANQNDERARVALELVHSPNRFLSTVQIGITLVGVMAGAFGGATIAGKIQDAFQVFPALAPYGEAIGLTVVVVSITYF